MQTITQTRTSTPTTEVKTFPVPSFWKEEKGLYDSYNTFYGIIDTKKIIVLSVFNDLQTVSIRLQDRLHSCDKPEIEITDAEFFAAYEAGQLAIVDAFEIASPQAVNLEMSER